MASGADQRAPRRASRGRRAGDHHAVVLGAAGLLGHAVVDALLPVVGRVTALIRRPQRDVSWWPPFDGTGAGAGAGVEVTDGVDASRWDELGARLDELAPDTIVNCAGVTPRRAAAADPVAAIAVNSLLPHQLARWAAGSGCRLITISTDCVFPHEPGGFTESDPPTATDLYGRTKALGEVTDGAAVTLRTSFVGRELVGGTELLEWFLSNAGGTVPGYAEVWYSGLPVRDVAATIARLATTHRELVGLHHLAAPEPIAKLDLLRLADEAFATGVTIVPDRSVVSHRTLDGRRLASLLPIEPVRWDVAFAELAADRRYDRRPGASGDPQGAGRRTGQVTRCG